MSTKYVLLPQQNYYGLLKKKGDETAPKTQIGDDLDEKGNFNFIKKELGKAKGRNVKNLSTKNVLYNQLLRSYLKLRKQLIQKPVKVELTKSGPTLISKTVTEGDEAAKALINEDGDSVFFDRRSMSPIERDNEEESINFGTAYSRTPVQSSRSTNKSTAESSRTSYSSIHSTPKKPAVSERQRKRKEKEEEELKRLEEIGKKIFKIVKNNPQQFGVTSEEEIINPRTGKAVPYSSLRHSLTRLLKPTTKNAPSPAGMKFFRTALNKNEDTYALVNQIQSGKGAVAAFGIQHFKPSKWGKIGTKK
jgi:hypothetical protein